MITINVGQAGNRLGYDILDSLYNHLDRPEDRDLMNHYFREVRTGVSKKWISRSVWLDTETSAVDHCIHRSQQSRSWFLDERCAEFRDLDTGSNWARAYQQFAAEFSTASVDVIRQELERVDVQTTLMMVHSVGGGTGSGLGTRLTEILQDEVKLFPVHTIDC
jgi:tubulin delta